MAPRSRPAPIESYRFPFVNRRPQPPLYNNPQFPDEFFLAPNTSRLSEDMEITLVELENKDPCKMTDDERDLITRMKRRQDAYKTALCDAFRRTGACSYGEKCRFAHNQAELRCPTQPRGRLHPKYKTVLCENFERDGSCRYGQRCQYIHRDKKGNLSFLDANAMNASFGGYEHGTGWPRQLLRPCDLNATLPVYVNCGNDFAPFYEGSDNGFGRSIDMRTPSPTTEMAALQRLFMQSGMSALRTAPSPSNPVPFDAPSGRDSRISISGFSNVSGHFVDDRREG